MFDIITFDPSCAPSEKEFVSEVKMVYPVDSGIVYFSYARCILSLNLVRENSYNFLIKLLDTKQCVRS